MLIHIQQKLDIDLSLDQLADVANFSPFHFHRIFRSLVGESVKEHVRRLRLERSAHRLRHSTQSVTEISSAAGYQSLESFSRAFHKMFEQSPTSYRSAQSVAAYRNGSPRVHFSSGSALADFQPVLKQPPELAVEFEVIPEMRLAFARHVGSYDETDEALERLFKWAGRQGLLAEGPTVFGIAYDDPEVTPSEKLRYDAAMVVPEDVNGEGEIGIQTLPRRRYACTIHVGPYEALAKTYSLFCGEWLPFSGHEVLAAPALEFYLNSPQEASPENLQTRICLPIAS